MYRTYCVPYCTVPYPVQYSLNHSGPTQKSRTPAHKTDRESSPYSSEIIAFMNSSQPFHALNYTHHVTPVHNGSDTTAVVWILAWSILSVFFALIPICHNRHRRSKCLQLIGVLPWGDVAENTNNASNRTAAASATSRTPSRRWELVLFGGLIRLISRNGKVRWHIFHCLNRLYSSVVSKQS